MLTKQQLIADGCVPNRNMWIGDGWFWCKGCEKYTLHRAFSHRGDSDCYEVCLECNQYHGSRQLGELFRPWGSHETPASLAKVMERDGILPEPPTSNGTTTVDDILKDAVDLTRRYGKAITG